MKLIKSESPARSGASPVDVPEPKEKKALPAEEEKVSAGKSRCIIF